MNNKLYIIGIMFLILLVPNVLATISAHGLNFTTSASSGGSVSAGAVITPDITMTLFSITKTTFSGNTTSGTFCELYLPGSLTNKSTKLSEGQFSGDVCSFNQPYTLIAGTTYAIMINAHQFPYNVNYTNSRVDNNTNNLVRWAWRFASASTDWNQTISNLSIGTANGVWAITSLEYDSPGIFFYSPTPSDNTLYQNNTQNWIQGNVSGSGLNNISVYLSRSGTLVNTTFVIGNSTTFNYTNLANGIYTLNATAFNSTSQLWTENRIITIYNSIVTFTVWNNFSNSAINNFTVTLLNTPTSYLESETTTTGSVDFYTDADLIYDLTMTIPYGNFGTLTTTYTPNGSISRIINLTVNPINFGKVYLINEKNNSFFDCSPLFSCKLYYGDSNVSVYDFKTAGTYNITFDLGTQTKFRLELVYPITLDVITRYFDVTVVPDQNNIRLCANTINVTHYEMIIYSASSRPVNMLNPYSSCLVGGDYTRFAYQDAYILRTLTIDAPYYLYIANDTSQTFLVGIDGSVESFINIDTIEFRNTGYDVTVLGTALTIYGNQTSNQSIIRFINEGNDFINATAIVTDAVNGSVYLDSGYIFSPNNFTILFDYGLLNVSDSSLFKVTVCGFDSDGRSICESKYFTVKVGEVPELNPQLALWIAIFLILTGFTFTQTRTTLSWFGLIMLISALIVLAFSETTWYTYMLMGVDVIYLIWIGLYMGARNKESVI